MADKMNYSKEELRNKYQSWELTWQQVANISKAQGWVYKTDVAPTAVTPVNPVVSETPITPTQVETPKIEPTTTPTPTKVETPDANVINETIQPNWQSKIDKALDTKSVADVKTLVDSNKANFSKYQYDQINSYLNDKAIAKETENKPVINSNDIFAQLQNGLEVDKTLINTPEYSDAVTRNTNLAKYSNIWPRWLSELMINWEILPWTTTYNDLKAKNPQAMQEAENLANLNSLISWEKADVNSFLTQISKTILNNYYGDTNDLQTKLSENKRVWDINTELTTLSTELADLKDSIDNMSDDMDKQYEWTWARKWYIQAKAALQANDLVRKYNMKLATYNALWGELQNITNGIKYDIEQAQAKQANQIEWLKFLYDVWSDQQAYERSLEERKYQEDLATKQLEQKYAYAYWDLNSTNPTLQNIAIEQAVAGMYETYPIQWMESQATKVQKVKDRIAQGMTPTEAIASVEQEIRNSPWYKDLMTYQKSQMTPEATDKWTKLNDTQLYNTATWETKTIWPKQAEVIDLQEWDVWWQCGTFARQYSWISWSLNDVVWATASERLKKFTDKEAQVWWLVFFNGWNYDKTYWHIAVVESINDDWTLNLIESNLNWDEKVTKRTVSPREVTWYYNQTPLAWNKTYDDTQISDLAYLVELQEKNPSQAAKDMKELWYTPKDIANYKAWNMPLTEKQKTNSIDLMNDIVNLVTNYDWNDAVGKFDYTRALWQDAEDAKIIIDNLVAKLTLPNLWALKWPMSDKDIAFITAASSKLWTTQSNKSFERNLVDAYNISARRSWVPEIKSLDEIKTDKTKSANNEQELFDNLY